MNFFGIIQQSITLMACVLTGRDLSGVIVDRVVISVNW